MPPPPVLPRRSRSPPRASATFRMLPQRAAAPPHAAPPALLLSTCRRVARAATHALLRRSAGCPPRDATAPHAAVHTPPCPCCHGDPCCPPRAATPLVLPQRPACCHDPSRCRIALLRRPACYLPRASAPPHAVPHALLLSTRCYSPRAATPPVKPFSAFRHLRTLHSTPRRSTRHIQRSPRVMLAFGQKCTTFYPKVKVCRRSVM